MSVTKKFAALGAAAAISATGLVAATGTSAHAANITRAVSYNCDLSSIGLGEQLITTEYSVPTIPMSLPKGTAIPSQAVSAKITVPPAVSSAVAAVFGGKIDGTVSGNVAFGAQKVAANLSIPSQSVTAGEASVVNATGTLAGFTAGTAGAQAVKLPASVHAEFQNGGVKVDCAALGNSNLSLETVTVSNGSTTGTTNSALNKAEAKLKADQAKLKKLKKALKKATGHKKAVLKKKIVKLNKTIKADKAAVAAAK